MSTQITKEDLLNFTHQLHCKLRGAKGIKLTGLPALNEIENILFFRFIEEMDEIKKDIPVEIRFTTICEKYASDVAINEDKKIPKLSDRNCYKLWTEFYDGSNKNCILIKYFNNEQIKKYIKSSVTRVSAFIEKKEVCQTIQILFNMVYNKFANITFDSKFYDIFGAAHEEFKTNEHGNSGKHTGQHFTPMDIKKLVVEELNIKSTESYYEPCAGTGGFIHTVDKYVREKEGDNASIEFKKRIYANECNPEMIKPLMINMLLHGIPVDNINETDSLGWDNITKMKGQVDTIGTNYPFGMSNDIDLNDYGKDGKEYWKPLIRGKTVIKNSTGQFILHIFHSLNDAGRAGFVSDRGILNNGDEKSWESDIRKFIISGANVYKIWLLPNGVFPYTNFATCVIFFKKGELTTQVKIYNGKFLDEKNKTGLYIESIPTKIFTLQELIANGYTFKMEEKVEEVKKGWASVKLGGICELYPTTKHCTSIGKKNGKYRFYSSSQTDKLYIDEAEIKKESIIIGNGGSANVHYDTNFTPSKHVTCCFMNNEQFNTLFIYYFLRINIFVLENEFSGGGLKWLNREKIKNIQIPELSLIHQEEIVEFLDKQFELYDVNLLAKSIKDLPIFNLLINKKYDLFADALHLIYRKMELDGLQKQMEKDKKAVFNIRVEGLECIDYKLGEIVQIERGKSLPKTQIIEGVFPVISGCSEIINYHNETNCDGNNYIFMARVGSAGNVLLCDNKCYLTDLAFAFKCEYKICKKLYLYYYLKYNNIEIKKIIQTNGPPNINGEMLKETRIQIPSLNEQEKIIKDIEKIDQEQKSYSEYGKLIQVQIDLISKVIKKQEIPIINNDNDGNEINNDDNDDNEINDDDNDDNESNDNKSTKSNVDNLENILEKEITESNLLNYINILNKWEIKKGEKVIEYSVKKINELWKKNVQNYISKKYSNIENKKKYLQARKDLIECKVLEPLKINYDKITDSIIFKNGTNIFSNLRDLGCKNIPIITNKETAKILEEKFNQKIKKEELEIEEKPKKEKRNKSLSK